MNEKLMRFQNVVLDAWENLPWIRAAGMIGFTVAGLLVLNSELPSEVAIDISNLAFKENIPIAIVILYFFLVSVFSGDRLRFEKKLRALEQNFRYDNRGTLFNGGEPNIAFRVSTFKGIFEGIAATVGDEELGEILTSSGRVASLDFANNLEEIYNEDVAMQRAKSTWNNLSVADKLSQWADYDSATGWGILACTIDNDGVKVIINHLQGLFEGDGGKMFGFFLAGYSETVITAIIREHGNARYSDYEGCTFVKVNHSDKYTLELEYTLF